MRTLEIRELHPRKWTWGPSNCHIEKKDLSYKHESGVRRTSMTNKNMSFNSFCYVYSQHAEALRPFLKVKTRQENLWHSSVKYFPEKLQR